MYFRNGHNFPLIQYQAIKRLSQPLKLSLYILLHKHTNKSYLKKKCNIIQMRFFFTSIIKYVCMCFTWLSVNVTPCYLRRNLWHYVPANSGLMSLYPTQGWTFFCNVHQQTSCISLSTDWEHKYIENLIDIHYLWKLVR